MASRRVLDALPLISLQITLGHAVAAERVQNHNISLPIGCPKCPQSLRNPGSMIEFLVFDKQGVILFYGFSACISSSLQMRPGIGMGGAVSRFFHFRLFFCKTAPPWRRLASFGEKRKCRRKSSKHPTRNKVTSCLSKTRNSIMEPGLRSDCGHLDTWGIRSVRLYCDFVLALPP